VYSYSLNNIGTLLRTIVKSNNPNFVSLYQEYDKAVNASLDKLIAYFKEP
jgi:hypothetical protein